MLLPVGWVDVEVEPVLDGLALGHAREGQRRRHWAKTVLAFRHHRGANCDNSVVFVLHLVVKDRAPEPGETVGIGTVDRKLGELTGHVRTSQSSGSAKGHTLTNHSVRRRGKPRRSTTSHRLSRLCTLSTRVMQACSHEGVAP